VKGYIPAWGAFLWSTTLTVAARSEPPPAELAEARSLFAQAANLEAAGDYPAAAAKLEAVLAIKETPGLRYHLAHCQEQVGALVAAGTNYERAAELIQHGAPAPDVEPLLPLAARRLESRVSRLELVVPRGVNASAELDGRALPESAFTAALKVDPGPHRVLVRSPGHADFKADLSFSSGEHRTVRVLFDSRGGSVSSSALAPVPTPLEPPVSNGGVHRFGGREVVLLSEAALTLTGLGLGIGFTLMKTDAADRVASAQTAVDPPASTANRGCAGTPVPACAELQRALDDHQRASTIATASFVGAGVAATALALTWALWPGSSTTASLAVRPQAVGFELRAGGTF
jgi:tetratricopeptide (TPR) repeat protein